MRFESIQFSKMRMRPGLHPGPRWRSLQRSSDTLAGFKGAGPPGMGREIRGNREGQEKGGKGQQGR